MAAFRWLVVIGIGVLILVLVNNPDGQSFAGFNQVTLRAAAWGDGMVPVFESMRDGPDAPYRTVPDGTRCTRLDNEWYKLGSGDTALYFYKVDCRGTFGYVNRDRTRP